MGDTPGRFPAPVFLVLGCGHWLITPKEAGVAVELGAVIISRRRLGSGTRGATRLA